MLQSPSEHNRNATSTHVRSPRTPALQGLLTSYLWRPERPSPEVQQQEVLGQGGYCLWVRPGQGAC